MITSIGWRKWNPQICLCKVLQFIHSMKGWNSLNLLFVILSSISNGWCGLDGSVQGSEAASMIGLFRIGGTFYSWYCKKGIRTVGEVKMAQFCVLEQERAQVVLLILIWKSGTYHFFFWSKFHENNPQKTSRDGVICHWQLVKDFRIWHPSCFFFRSFVKAFWI